MTSIGAAALVIALLLAGCGTPGLYRIERGAAQGDVDVARDESECRDRAHAEAGAMTPGWPAIGALPILDLVLGVAISADQVAHIARVERLTADCLTSRGYVLVPVESVPRR